MLKREADPRRPDGLGSRAISCLDIKSRYGGKKGGGKARVWPSGRNGVVDMYVGENCLQAKGP